MPLRTPQIAFTIGYFNVRWLRDSPSLPLIFLLHLARVSRVCDVIVLDQKLFGFSVARVSVLGLSFRRQIVQHVNLTTINCPECPDSSETCFNYSPVSFYIHSKCPKQPSCLSNKLYSHPDLELGQRWRWLEAEGLVAEITPRFPSHVLFENAKEHSRLRVHKQEPRYC